MNIEKCIDCGKCEKHCVFLQKYQQNVVRLYQHILTNIPAHKDIPYRCFLCGKCTEVCPVDIHGEELMQDARNQIIKQNLAPLPQHQGLIKDKGNYIPKLYKKNRGKTMFFPGCHLVMYVPDAASYLINLFQKKSDTPIGIDCCSKPINDLGMVNEAKKMRDKLMEKISGTGASRIAVACPNCYYYFKQYLDIEVITVYQFLQENGYRYDGPPIQLPVHISCPDRFDRIFQKDIASLGEGKISLEPLPTQCCGWGGAAGAVDQDLEQQCREPFKKCNPGQKILTYCSGCLGSLSRADVNVQHIIRLILGYDTHDPGEKSGPRGFLNRVKVWGRHCF